MQCCCTDGAVHARANRSTTQARPAWPYSAPPVGTVDSAQDRACDPPRLRVGLEVPGVRSNARLTWWRMSHQFSDGLSGALVEGVEADGTDACGGAVIGEHRERGEGGGELLIEGRVRSAVVHARAWSAATSSSSENASRRSPGLQDVGNPSRHLRPWPRRIPVAPKHALTDNLFR